MSDRLDGRGHFASPPATDPEASAQGDRSYAHPTPVAPSSPYGTAEVYAPAPPPIPREGGYVTLAESVARHLELLLADATCLSSVRQDPELDARLRSALEESRLLLQALHAQMNR